MSQMTILVHKSQKYVINNNMIVEKDISSLMVVTDRDEASDVKIGSQINDSLEQISVENNCWKDNAIQDSFGQAKSIQTRCRRYVKKNCNIINICSFHNSVIMRLWEQFNKFKRNCVFVTL